MKKYIILFALLALVSLPVKASELVCEEGKEVKSVMVSEAVIGVPALTHTISHEAITHETTVVDTPAYTSYDFVGFGHGDYIKIGGNYYKTIHNHGNYDKVSHPAVTHTEIVVDTPAWEEVVIDAPAVVETPAINEDQCIAIPVVEKPVLSHSRASGSGSRGYMSPCEYIKVYSSEKCNYSEDLRVRFALDNNYRESILAKWRMVIFGR
jgi:hypothetical protein